MKLPWHDIKEKLAKTINDHVGERVWPEVVVRSVRESHLTDHVRIKIEISADVPKEAAYERQEEQA